jgi:hypothetical protein
LKNPAPKGERFCKTSVQRGKGFENVVRKGSLRFENRQTRAAAVASIASPWLAPSTLRISCQARLTHRANHGLKVFVATIGELAQRVFHFEEPTEDNRRSLSKHNGLELFPLEEALAHVVLAQPRDVRPRRERRAGFTPRRSTAARTAGCLPAQPTVYISADKRLTIGRTSRGATAPVSAYTPNRSSQ